ncbi:MAG: hypothetical protein EXX96DRAFT_618477 [Benjaminiella poitrasii]|nr:MAG: hypothetical protein EXX96DRAFT_618477 [Benjaminiella poitrasii]
MSNILTDGDKKYNQKKRKDTKKNRKKAKEIQQSQQIKVKKPKRWKSQPFEENIKAIPLIVFGDGMKNKDHVRIKGYTTGACGILYSKLAQRQKQHLLALVDVDEFLLAKHFQ